MLLLHKIDINQEDSNGQTPLMHAVQWGDADKVPILLAEGISIFLKKTTWDAQLPCLQTD